MTGSRSIGVSGRRASTRWPPTSMSSRKEKAMSAPNRIADDELLIVRTFNAPPSVVFALWSNAEHMKRWMGPKNFTCSQAIIDFRVGGAYRAMIKSAEHGES